MTTQVIEIPMYRFMKGYKKENGEEVEFWEDDTIPDSPDYITIFLPEANFPRTTKTMTAETAGNWAIRRCIANHWEVTPENIWAALANLEIDMD